MNQQIKLPRVMLLTGLSKAGVYRLMAQKKFPRQKKLGLSSYWELEKIEEWIKQNEH